MSDFDSPWGLTPGSNWGDTGDLPETANLWRNSAAGLDHVPLYRLNLPPIDHISDLNSFDVQFVRHMNKYESLCDHSTLRSHCAIIPRRAQESLRDHFTPRPGVTVRSVRCPEENTAQTVDTDFCWALELLGESASGTMCKKKRS